MTIIYFICKILCLIAHPRRVNIQTHFIRQVGEPVILLNGVGEGALGEHYSPRWFKDGLLLTNANVSRGNDFSLHVEAVKLSDAGAYVSSVSIWNGNFIEYTIQENDRPIRLTVFGEFLNSTYLKLLFCCIS